MKRFGGLFLITCGVRQQMNRFFLFLITGEVFPVNHFLYLLFSNVNVKTVNKQ